MTIPAIDPTVASVIAVAVAIVLGILMYEIRNVAPRRDNRDDYDWDV